MPQGTVCRIILFKFGCNVSGKLHGTFKNDLMAAAKKYLKGQTHQTKWGKVTIIAAYNSLGKREFQVEIETDNQEVKKYCEGKLLSSENLSKLVTP